MVIAKEVFCFNFLIKYGCRGDYFICKGYAEVHLFS